MTTFDSIRRRITQIETARGAGAVNLTFPDGSKQGFHLDSKNAALEILLASFEIARAAGDPDAPPPSRTRAVELAWLIAKAEQIAPHDPLFDTVTAIVREAENCTTHAPDPASS